MVRVPDHSLLFWNCRPVMGLPPQYSGRLVYHGQKVWLASRDSSSFNSESDPETNAGTQKRLKNRQRCSLTFDNFKVVRSLTTSRRLSRSSFRPLWYVQIWNLAGIYVWVYGTGGFIAENVDNNRPGIFFSGNILLVKRYRFTRNTIGGRFFM